MCSKTQPLIFLQVVTSTEACIELTKSTNPDIVMTEVQMSKGSTGYALAQYVQKHHASTKVIAHTILTDRVVCEAMIRCGAKGFIGKKDGEDELEKAIYAVYNNQYYVSSQYQINEDEIKAIQNRYIEWLENITPKEIHLAELLAQNLTLEQAANNLNISYSVASKKRKNLFYKTNTDSVIGLIDFLKKVGILS
ncbi:MAG: DNA-binding response regulator [Sphingobacteriia bacterium]|nr:MAG: DNA-binding response regulator [Sphingobacteriia bacterium]